MRRCVTRIGALMIGAAVSACWLTMPAAAQAPSAGTTTNAPARKQTLPRTPWGDPDFQGAWSTDDTIGVPIERPDRFGDRLWLTDQEIADRAAQDERARQRALEERPAAPAAAPGGAAPIGPPDHWGEQGSRTARQTSFVVDPPNGKIPVVTPEGQRRAAGRDRGSFGKGPFNSPEDFTNYDRCITRSVVGSILPRPYGNGLRIVQSPGYVAITHEMIHETRVIPVTPVPHVSRTIRLYMGDSRGRWEGDTLVVETMNFTDRTSVGFNGNGLRHSEAMRLVERFSRVDADTIQYEVTFDDPQTYVRPFKMALQLTTQPGYDIFEYACHEGNYGLPNILGGARADERK